MQNSSSLNKVNGLLSYLKSSILSLLFFFFIFAWIVSAENLLLSGVAVNFLQIISSVFAFTEHFIYAVVCVFILLLLRQLKIPVYVLVIISFLMGLLLIADRIFYQNFYQHLSFTAIESGTKITQLWGSFYDEMGDMDFINLAIWSLLQIPIAILLAQTKLYIFPAGETQKLTKSFLLLFTLVFSTSIYYFLAVGNVHYNPYVRLGLELFNQQQQVAETDFSKIEKLPLNEIYQPMFAENTSNSDLSNLANSKHDKKNVILIVLESVGGLQLFPDGKIDGSITPFLASIKEKTSLFNNIYTYYPATTRAHVPLQTGGVSITYATTKQLEYRYNGPTLTSSFKAEKYKTALFSAQALDFGNLDRFYQQMGFDSYFDPNKESKSFREANKVHSWGVFETSILPKAMNWIDIQQQKNSPFMLQFFTVATHHPYGYPGSEKERNELSRSERYAKSLHYTDDFLKQVWTELKQKNLLDNTLVYITGDHGQAFGIRHKKNFTHRNYLYQENVGTFLLRIDNNQKEEKSSERVGSIADVMPTIVTDVTGKNVGNIIGQNLFSSNYQARLQFFHKHQKPLQWGIRDGKWKFISKQAGTNNAELYDLSIDAKEQNNLAQQYPERIIAYQKRIAQWSATMQARFDHQLKADNLLTLSAEELSHSGPKKLRLGLRPGGGTLQTQTTFHPDEDITAQLFRIPDGKTHQYEYIWTNPANKVFHNKVKVKAGWERVYNDLDYPKSMEVGQWQVKVITEHKKVFQQSFTVDKNAKLIDPRFRALGPRQVSLYYLDNNKQLQQQDTFHPKEKVILLTQGLPYFRDTKLDIIWTSPLKRQFKQQNIAIAQKEQLRIDASNLFPLEEGQWKVQIKFNKTILTEAFFQVDKNQALHQPINILEGRDNTSHLIKTIKDKPVFSIIILDDNVNKAHIQAYGYHRKNMPQSQQLIDDKELIKFNKIYNDHPKALAMQHSILLPDKNQLEKNNFPSLLDLLRQAKIPNTWVNGKKATVYDSFYAQLAQQQLVLPETDGVLDSNKLLLLINEQIKKSKAKQEKSHLIVVRIPQYDNKSCLQHFTDKFNKTLPEGWFGRFADTPELSNQVNCHDNYLLHIDDLLTKITQLPALKNKASMLWYGSEYTPHIFEKTGHNRENLSNKVRDIPLLAWFSKPFQQQNQQQFHQILQHTNTAYPINHFFNTLVGLLPIETTSYNPSHDLASPLLVASPIDQRKFGDDDETLSKYIQTDNIHKLIKTEQDLRILPHRNNSFGKISQILDEGLQAFEIDLVFDDNSGYFEVGHDNATMSSVHLKDILQFIPQSIKKIWFDVKNITPENIHLVLKRLNELQQLFPIKERVIIESTIEDDIYVKLAEQGYYTSYYMPTIEFLNLHRKNNTKALDALADRIIQQVEKQQVKALSFDSKLYQFVKNKIEDRLWKKLDYHTWDMDLQSRDINFIPTLSSKDFYYDERIKTILYAYYTEYTL